MIDGGNTTSTDWFVTAPENDKTGKKRTWYDDDERAAFDAGSGIIGPGRRGPTTDGSDGPLPRAALCSAMQESAQTLTKQLLYR